MNNNLNKNSATTRVTQVALLLALEIILSRFFAIPTPIVKISLAFIPIVIVAMLYGPFYSALVAGLGDFIGAQLFPTGPYFPGFTLSAILVGAVYGIILYNKEKTWVRVFFVATIVTMFIHLGLDTLWVKMITGKAYIALFPPRILKSLVMLPVQAITIKLVSEKLLSKVIKNY